MQPLPRQGDHLPQGRVPRKGVPPPADARNLAQGVGRQEREHFEQKRVGQPIKLRRFGESLALVRRQEVLRGLEGRGGGHGGRGGRGGYLGQLRAGGGPRAGGQGGEIDDWEGGGPDLVPGRRGAVLVPGGGRGLTGHQGMVPEVVAGADPAQRAAGSAEGGVVAHLEGGGSPFFRVQGQEGEGGGRRQVFPYGYGRGPRAVWVRLSPAFTQI